MKTIKQIADEIGVSKQAVYKRFKGKLYTEVLPYVDIKDGVTYISEQGEDIVKMDFSASETISEGAHTKPHTERIRDTATDMLIQMLQRELEVKNKQIEELTTTIKIQAESISADRKNELAGTIIDGQQKLITNGEKDKKKRWQFWKKG